MLSKPRIFVSTRKDWGNPESKKEREKENKEK
jgi:hypothetical protein